MKTSQDYSHTVSYKVGLITGSALKMVYELVLATVTLVMLITAMVFATLYSIGHAAVTTVLKLAGVKLKEGSDEKA